MNKQLIRILSYSVTIHVVSGIVMYSQHKKLIRFRDEYDKLATWTRMMNDITRMHFENGGTFRVTDEMVEKIDAYKIFVENDLF